MMYSGELGNLVEARECIRDSFDIKVYEAQFLFGFENYEYKGE